MLKVKKLEEENNRKNFRLEKAIVTIDTNPGDIKYLDKGGKEVKVSKKYKDSIEHFMGA